MKKYFIILGVVATTVGTGCKKFIDVNDDPNNPITTTASYQFTNALEKSYRNGVGGVNVTPGSWVGYYGHSTSFTGGGTEKTYQFTNADFNFFDGLYDNLNDYQYVINNAAAEGNGWMIGPSEVMKAYVFQQLVDMHGDVPYSEALKQLGNIAPKYDDDQAIYEGLITDLTNAIAKIKAATFPAAALAGADIYFKGNQLNWIKFANTLKMRILMRQSFMPGRDTYITARINEIVTEGSGFITDNVYVQPGYAKAVGKLNPFYATYGFTDVDAQTSNFAYRKMGSVLVDWLKASNDAFRLQRLAYPRGTANVTIPPVYNPSDYVGIPLGASGSGYLEGATSSIGPIQIVKGDAVRAGILMTLAEAHFLLAEAGQRYAIAALGTPQANYEAGIRASFRLAAATQTSTPSATNAAADAAAATYYGQAINNVGWTASTDKIKAILIQKWVALANIDGLNAWSEYRKSSGSTSVGVPASVKSVAVGGAQPEPVRFYYPLREENVNSANVPQGINVFTSKIFWDVN